MNPISQQFIPKTKTRRSKPVATRGRDIHEQHRVSTPLELLFDLTFVVAIAMAAAQLHHGIVEHHTGQAVIGYLLAFAAIWWAWMNYTWFASAYDNDDALFRILTMLQMAGVLLFATGVPGLFAGQFLAATAGYVVMRLALCTQWLRAAKGDPLRRKTCLRYAIGVALVQVAWVVFMLSVNSGIVSGGTLWIIVVLLWIWELSVPAWAESAGGTPWHAHHIAERYGLMAIIVLGECVLGTTNVIASMWEAHGWSFDLLLVGFAGTLLLFSMWWMYFLLPAADALHHHRERGWIWGYGHFFVFAAIAAVGAGLEVAADVLKAGYAHADTATNAPEAVAHGVSATYAITMLAIAESIYIVALWSLYRYATRIQGRQLTLLLIALVCIALVPVLVSLGLPLPWGMLLLSVGPVIIIAYNEHGRRNCAEFFQMH